jgi:hypothetical protein
MKSQESHTQGQSSELFEGRFLPVLPRIDPNGPLKEVRDADVVAIIWNQSCFGGRNCLPFVKAVPVCCKESNTTEIRLFDDVLLSEGIYHFGFLLLNRN